ncbi:nuclear transport factor 2 family protein [Glutamicibacter sp. NPDC055491]
MTTIDPAALESELRIAEERRLSAMLARDLETLENLLEPDVQYTHSTGRVDDRDSLLELLGSGAVEYLALSHDFESVTQEGNVVVVEGSMKMRLISGGVEKHLATANRTVWANTGGQWKLRLFVGATAQ